MLFIQFLPIDERKIVRKIAANYRSKNRRANLGGTNYCSKICKELSCTANYCLKLQ